MSECWPDCENCDAETIPSDDGLCYGCSVRGLLREFTGYLARASADEADEEPLTTALYQFGRDVGPSRRTWLERELTRAWLARATR